MTQTGNGSRDTTPLLAATLALALVVAVVIMLTRGIWLDEAYSMWFARHDVGFADALFGRWLRDGHPPLYPAYTWLLEPWFGASVERFRLINFGSLAAAGATAMLVRRHGGTTVFYWLFAMLVATTPFFLLYAAELRSYFLQLLLSACLLAQLRLLLDGGASRALWAILAFTAIVLVGLHYVASVTSLIVLGLAVLLLLHARRWRAAAGLAAIAAVALALLVGWLLLYLRTSTPTNNNQIGLAAALVAIAAPLGAGFASNVVAAGAAALVALRRGIVWDRFTILLVSALPAVAAVYLAYNMVLHNVVSRFLIAAVPLSSALLAQLLAGSGRLDRRLVAAICAVGAIVAAGTLGYSTQAQRWNSNAAAIRDAIRRCPETRVIGLSALSFLDANGAVARSIGTEPAFPLGYELVARREGFPVTTAYRGAPRTILGDRCPTLVWLEHRYIAAVPDAALIRAAGIVSPTGRIASRVLQSSPERALLAVSIAP